ncbi:fused chemotactic sensory histidine kinase in two-component regulatory system with CheB and CheY: sensory histidine kinase; signal sensing protein [Alteromonas sp. 38]|uniref:chemotaxis protein CheA n=1 Tax=unclassified Alteromonas TaxID=2614992 RepID=UPI0012F13336|nr:MULTISPECIES: chemotaxis protein CheW [unclassified Alteromonas]CAD5254338.1 fused chemotactic sensory histidine kinase in two-component regulatory system with CheB and CheY: sensory histidine kinase; signal sensing protein [Alteromonas sp. 154]VXB04672.1 fused chemotactic sensory histidine kinase in two-component regulatory system with CheB and CheY: sensory histidine kinase; signal sensing protein [Alteromonas sp. 38]
MSIDIEQFHGVFFDESDEHLDDMEQLLISLDVDSPDSEELNSIFRAAHSIKGGSGIFGFNALMNLTHVMENLLDKARNQELSVTTNIVNLLLETLDVLKATLAAYRNQVDVPEQAIAVSITKLEKALTETQETTAPDTNIETSNHQNVDSGNGFDNGNDSTHSDNGDAFGFFDDTPSETTASVEDDGFGFFDEPEVPVIKSLASDDSFGFFDTADIPPPNVKANESVGTQSAASPVQSSPVPTNAIQSSVAPDTAANKSTSPPPSISKSPARPARKTGGRDSASIRVDTGKIDAMVNLVGELVITQSMLSLIGQEVDGQVGERLQVAIDELQRNTREIQESVMSVRMLPLTATFNRFPRLVRDLAGKLDKKVDLVLQGAHTEIDKSLIEKLVDPLTHLVRNSIDHGIELPEKRRAAGKSEMGTVILGAEQKGGSIIISIIDDGGGLNRARILDKARTNGLAVNDDIPDSEVWQLIFQAGFSTAEAVTDVSGRGVGMDVVRRNIEAIGGRIEIESSLGEGSGFFIHLPLTLAIVDGMCVSVGSQIFVIPLLNIVESFQPTASQLKTLGNDTVLYIRDQYWPLVPLHDYMDVENANRKPTEAIVVLLESSKKRFGVLVDALVGQQQVVIKSLEDHYRKVAGIAGATIMGDGKVALIIDADSIATTYTSSQIEDMLA